ncbi:hypothetical protein [Actinoplanes sp. NPDC020271]|uniref:hypothetical protein n=1 Tax=Actinoplanes sp. NPDC020271 TaxID=3363896 RepID=UPI00379B4DAD
MGDQLGDLGELLGDPALSLVIQVFDEVEHIAFGQVMPVGDAQHLLELFVAVHGHLTGARESQRQAVYPRNAHRNALDATAPAVLVTPALTHLVGTSGIQRRSLTRQGDRSGTLIGAGTRS